MSASNEAAATGTCAQRPAASRTLAGLAWSFVAVGSLLRLRQYFFDRSFWLDECMLALNILQRSFGGLLRPLDHHQHAPVAFLLLEKSVCGILGTSERALRLIPLLAAIVSLVLLRAVGRRTVGNLAAVLAIALFAFSEHLIYYSSELKQYSSDAAVGLSLFLLALPVLDEGLSRPRAVVLAAAGAAAIWLSHPAVFVLAGIALTAGIVRWRRRDRASTGRLLLVTGCWGISLAADYALALRHSAGDAVVRTYWGEAFLPLPPRSIREAGWIVERFFATFASPLGLGGGFAALGALAFVVGCTVGFRDRRSRLAMLLSPILFTLVASALRRYPFEGRFLLFLAAPLLLVVGEGARRALERDRVVGSLLIGLLLLFPVKRAAQDFVHPQTHQELKSVLEQVRKTASERDLLYGYRSSPAFGYYLPRFGLEPGRYVGGTTAKEDWPAYARDLEALRGRGRIWIVFPGLSERESQGTVPFFLYTLDRLGTRLDAVERPGAAAYLYDLRRPPDRPSGEPSR